MPPQISMFDKSETNPSELLLGAMSDVASVSWYEAGSFVSDFEQTFAQMLGVEHCVSCASGTDALILALKALACTQGDEIALVSMLAFMARLQSIRFERHLFMSMSMMHRSACALRHSRMS